MLGVVAAARNGADSLIVCYIFFLTSVMIRHLEPISLIPLFSLPVNFTGPLSEIHY